jgi:membrane-associated protease RseP (regulator of RpoE activity)
MDAGFSLVKKKKLAIPNGNRMVTIGGYVKLSGMIDESMDTNK